jgi:hypothetical protein
MLSAILPIFGPGAGLDSSPQNCYILSIRLLIITIAHHHRYCDAQQPPPVSAATPSLCSPFQHLYSSLHQIYSPFHNNAHSENMPALIIANKTTTFFFYITQELEAVVLTIRHQMVRLKQPTWISLPIVEVIF